MIAAVAQTSEVAAHFRGRKHIAKKSRVPVGIPGSGEIENFTQEWYILRGSSMYRPDDGTTVTSPSNDGWKIQGYLPSLCNRGITPLLSQANFLSISTAFPP